MKTAAATRMLALAVAVVAALLIPSAAGAVSRTPYGTNLVKNPGAEAGQASIDGESGVDIPHWDTLGTFTVVHYGTPTFYPSAAEGHRIHGAHQFFSAGPHETVSQDCDEAVQPIRIHRRSAAIDSGHVKVTLSARLGTYDSQTDTANVVLSFRDGRNEALTTPDHDDLTLAPVTSSHSKLQLESASKTLPSGTRILRVILSASDVYQYCDAYFDNIVVKLTAI